MKKKNIIIVLATGLVLVFLFSYKTLFSDKKSVTASSSVPCLVPNFPLVQHAHAELRIFVDGVEEKIPKDIGLDGCERALHTHEEDNVIHIEAQDRHEYTLNDFFSVWRETITRDGYSQELKVNEEIIQNHENVILADKQKIEIIYTKLN